MRENKQLLSNIQLRFREKLSSISLISKLNYLYRKPTSVIREKSISWYRRLVSPSRRLAVSSSRRLVVSPSRRLLSYDLS